MKRPDHINYKENTESFEDGLRVLARIIARAHMVSLSERPVNELNPGKDNSSLIDEREHDERKGIS